MLHYVKTLKLKDAISQYKACLVARRFEEESNYLTDSTTFIYKYTFININYCY